MKLIDRIGIRTEGYSFFVETWYSALGDSHVSNYQEQPHVYADSSDTEQPE